MEDCGGRGGGSRAKIDPTYKEEEEVMRAE